MPSIILLTFAVMANTQPRPSNSLAEIVTCALGDGRSAVVGKTGNRYSYTFGKISESYITIIADHTTKSAYWHSDVFPRAGLTELRFVNGATSYILFHYFNLGDYVRDYEGATEVSGLLVYRDGRRIAEHRCRSGSGLEDGANLAPLPEDPLDLTSDIIDRAEAWSKRHGRYTSSHGPAR